jgi:hypothetical protein
MFTQGCGWHCNFCMPGMRAFITSLLITISCILLLCNCAKSTTDALNGGRPQLELIQFFTGRTHSDGVFESRSGRPGQRITTETNGKLKDGVLYIEQDLSLQKGKRQHRSWQLRRVDESHIDATANDIIRTAHGASYGNVFYWTFRLRLSPGNPLKNVRMSQYMYLQPDGRSLIIRSVIRKAGIIVAEVTEQFWKE